jgi:cathepsin B
LLVAVLLGVANARVVLDNVDIVEKINAMKTTWTAVKSDAGQIYKMGVAADYGKIFREEAILRVLPINTAAPDSFDCRTQWPGCVGDINDIRDQGQCGSCWAVAAAEVYTDRACIATNDKVNMPYSSWDVGTCCKPCAPGEACQGGYPNRAWDWLASTGVVTGGPVTNRTGCKPYPTGFGDEVCHEVCSNTDYKTPYAQDKRKASSSWGVPDDISQIQAALMKGGPLEATFVVYNDFFNYRSGVYRHVTGGMAGRHAVRLIGWGVDTTGGVNTPYWMVANSWGSSWGMNGWFKILRGSDECEFESGIVAGDVK